MGKHARLAAPKAAVPKAAPHAKPRESDHVESEDEQHGDEADLLLDRTVRHLELLLGMVEAAIDKGEATPALLRESSSVARAISTLCAEQRLRAKQALAGRELSMVDVTQYLRAAPPRERAIAMRLLEELQHGRSGLA